MKILMINGSCNAKGSTFTALSEIASQLEKEGLESEIFDLGAAPVRDCIGCGKCTELGGKCVFDDDVVNRLIEKAAEADGFVFGTPVYYAHASGRVLSVLDRAFYAGSWAFCHKPGAAIAVARRGGTTAAIDDLNKYFTINQMPVVSSTYWNMVHGHHGSEIKEDLEGLQTMRFIATNMAWLLRCIKAGEEKGINPPENKKEFVTSFIRP